MKLISPTPIPGTDTFIPATVHDPPDAGCPAGMEKEMFVEAREDLGLLERDYEDLFSENVTDEEIEDSD